MKPYRAHLLVCAGTGCVSNGSIKIKAALENEIKRHGLEDEILIVTTGCNGFCAAGPIVMIQPDGIFYQFLEEKDVPYLVEEHLLKGRPVKRLMYTSPEAEEPIPKMKDIGFFSNQLLIALRNRGLIDPEQIDDYIGREGYDAFGKALIEMTSEEIIKVVKNSGLRGRGGAGFPTGQKWEFCRNSKGDEKYIICNADEGDPGAFMDRSILEADPHSVLEGMVIGAKAIGTNQGYIYVRAEYPLALKRLHIAMEQAREYGLLGENILDSGFDFDIKVIRGGGAFVCGEETALMASVEGRIGEPRQRPPFPAQKGLWSKPTNINNVETWANIPVIISRGAEWYSGIGTEKSKGTKVFSLVGKVNNTGLIEVPMGITMRQIVYDIGGGIPNGKRFKAVQTGGPSGGCIPESLLDLRVDYEELTKTGAIMGSGGMIVLDENTCMVDMARYFLDFLKEESCGKCVPCREGIQRMLEILNDICEGRGKEEDIELLEELSQMVKDFSLCALGGTAPNPVLSTIRHFRNEYEAHIKYKRCPAVVCRKIISSPCQHTCPINTDVPAYIAYIARGRFQEAIDVIRRTNPLPIVCGRVCHHPCEERCTSGEGGDAIAIRALKRFAADFELKHGQKAIIQTKSIEYEKVAIIGSGPAGLTAGYYLAQRGYSVTIFEALPVAGGMLAAAIPDYRLPKKPLNLDLDFIRKSGVTIRTNVAIGREIPFEDLFRQGFKVIFIAVGAHKSLKLDIPGEDAKGVLNPLEFLRAVNFGESVELEDRVAVVGGGNVAIDAARAAYRLGKQVTIIYRRTRAEMPALKEEIDQAIKEGIDIKFLIAPTKVMSTDSKLMGVECIRMKLGDFDISGRRRPVPIDGSEFTMEIGTLIPAIGQEPDLSFLPPSNGFKISKNNTFLVDSETLTTNKSGVFAGGDVVSGPATVTQAMAAGKNAAESIHKYLRGQSLAREYKVTRPSVDVEPLRLSDREIEELLELRRPEMPSLPVQKGVGNFDEVELGFTEAMAITEAKRCLRCDRET